MKTAQPITSAPLPAIQTVQHKRCLLKACSIARDTFHPSHRLFALLPSGRSYKSLRSRTSRLRTDFEDPVPPLPNTVSAKLLEMEARGKFEFQASTDDELSFKKGDILKILSTEDDWYKAEMQGQEGFIPQNYVEMHTPSWFQSHITRSAAEVLLMTHGVGGFVIRKGQTSPDDFSISVRHEIDVQHFKVMKDSKGQYFLWNDKFTSLNKLVEFYKTTSISKQREIFLKDDSQSDESSAAAQPLKRGSLPQERNSAASAVPQRRASDQPHSHQSMKVGMEERAQTFGGHSSRSSPLSYSAAPRRIETIAHPHQSAATLQVQALYDFTEEEADELGFCEGDIIDVLDRSDVLWWKGKLRGKIGLFPANYTSPL